MKNALIILLIMSMQSILSQEVTITENGATLLSPRKTIEVAKIIENEKRLVKRVEVLNNKLTQLNDSIQKIERKLVKSTNEIKRLSSVIATQHDDINKLDEQDLKLEKKKQNFGLYSYIAVGSDLDAFRTFDVGIALVKSKVIFTFSIDPILDKKPIYKIGVGLKFW